MLDECDTLEEMEDFIIKAYEKSNEERMFRMYLAIYPSMTKDTYKSFDEFIGKKECGKQSAKVENKKTQIEIINEVKEIMENM